jgi:hypothetical protein
MLALTEAKTNEKREAAKLVVTSEANKQQGAIWHQANEGLNAAKKALDDYVRDETERGAKANLAAE